jgi:hypothetical protein
VAVALLSSVRDLVVRLGDFDARLSTVDDCVTMVEELARLEKVAAAARAVAAARVAESNGHRGYADPAQWLARTAGSSQAEAARALEVARQLDSLPLTAEQVRSGDLSLAQADEVAKTVASCPEAESAMLEKAAGSSLRELRDFGRKTRLAAVPAEQLQARQHAARFHRQWIDDLGMLRYTGAMVPEAGVPLRRRVEIETDRKWRAARRAGRRETPEQLAADAFATVVGNGGKGHAVRADVVYVCDINAGTAHIIGGGPVPMATVDDTARDAFVKAVLHDGTKIDTIVHYGRKALPALLRTALELGPPPDFDGTHCVDCGNDLGLQNDHADPVANGGPTCLSNSRWRCFKCHAERPSAIGSRANSATRSAATSANADRNVSANRNASANQGSGANESVPVRHHERGDWCSSPRSEHEWEGRRVRRFRVSSRRCCRGARVLPCGVRQP